MLNGEFEKLLVEAIEESLSSLGDSPKQSILFHLENTFKIKKQEITDNITSFDVALKKLFGPGADGSGDCKETLRKSRFGFQSASAQRSGFHRDYRVNQTDDG